MAEEDTSTPTETDAPDSSPPGEASGVKVEKTESSPHVEESDPTKDVQMDEADGPSDEKAQESSPPGEESMPDISPDKDVEEDQDEELHDQGIWGKVKIVVDPEKFAEATRTASSAETEGNGKAFDNMEAEKEKQPLLKTPEFIAFWQTHHTAAHAVS